MTTPNVTRDQLLRAEMIVQLANIAEALQSLHIGTSSTRVTELETQVAELTAQLAAVTSLVQTSSGVTSTPDNLNEVFSQVGIQ
jgi:hypothetical protein